MSQKKSHVVLAQTILILIWGTVVLAAILIMIGDR